MRQGQVRGSALSVPFLPVVVGLTSVSLSGVMLLLRDWVALPDKQEAWKLALEPLIQPPWWFPTRFFEAWERACQVGYSHSELIWAGSPVIPWAFSRWHCSEDSGCAWGLSVSRSDSCSESQSSVNLLKEVLTHFAIPFEEGLWRILKQVFE